MRRKVAVAVGAQPTETPSGEMGMGFFADRAFSEPSFLRSATMLGHDFSFLSRVNGGELCGR